MQTETNLNTDNRTWLFKSVGPLFVHGTAAAFASLCLGGALNCALRMGEAGEGGGTSGFSAITVSAVEGAGAIFTV